MRITKVKRSLTIFAVLFLCLTVQGQTTVWEEDFSEFKTNKYDYGGYRYILLDENAPKPESWNFAGKCYAMDDASLLLGNSNGEAGTCTTPPFSYNGDVQVVMLIKSYGADTKFSLEVTGGGTPSETSCTFNSSEYCCKTFKIKNCTSSTRLSIIKYVGRCRINSIRVYPMNNKLFLESFDLMVSRDSHIPAKASNCDNSGSSFSADNAYENKKFIYFRNKTNSNYSLPKISNIVSGSNVILTFKSRFENTSDVKSIKVKCEGGALLSKIDDNFTLNSSGTEGTIESSGTNEDWEERRIMVTNMDANTQISFSGYYCELDDVSISLPVVTIDETSTDNATTIGNALGLRHVSLVRTLKPNIWNTLCLPFDITPASMRASLGSSANPVLLTLSSVSTDGVFHFSDVSDETTVAAGTPFLVKPAVNFVNPLFEDVTLTNTPAGAAAASTDNYKFIGTYSPVALNTDGSHLFLTTSNTLSSPSASTNTMNGLRAYFEVPKADAVRVTMDDTSNAIDAVELDTSSAPAGAVFDLQGRSHDASTLAKGIYVKGNRKFIVR